MARMEMDYNLKKLANLLKFSLWIDRVFGLESTLDRSFRKRLSQIFFSFQFIPITKSYRESYLERFEKKTAKLLWHGPFN